MRIPLEIVFRNLEPSPAVEAAVHERASKLERFADMITRCRVTIEIVNRHSTKGRQYHVVVDVQVPGGDALASHDPGRQQAHEDVYVAVRDSFNAARRQLQDHVRVQRGKVKQHVSRPHGRINSMSPETDCGWIITPQGREIYFHRNSVVNRDFDTLQVGMEVRFNEEAGEQGPQASSVHVVGKHHIIDRPGAR